MNIRYYYAFISSSILVVVAMALFYPVTIAFSDAPFRQEMQTLTPIALYLPYVANQPTPTATPTPTITPTPPTGVLQIDGTWRGTTAQAKVIGFTITNHSLVSLSWSYQIGGCGAENITTFSIPKPIVNNTFSYSAQAGFPSVLTSIKGAFTSDTTTSGTIKITGTPCGDFDGTWTATKG